MFSEGEIEAKAARVSARFSSLPMRFSSPGRHFDRATSSAASSFPASIGASRLVVPLLLAETAAFAAGVASDKIPAFLFTAIRALLTF